MSMVVTVTELKNVILKFKIAGEATSITLYTEKKIETNLRKFF